MDKLCLFCLIGVAILKLPVWGLGGSLGFLWIFFSLLALVFLISSYKSHTAIKRSNINLLVVCMLPYLFAFLFSAFFHGVNSRSALTLFYWVVGIVAAMMSVSIVKEKALFYSWVGCVFAFCVHIVLNFVKNGYISLEMLELHEISFALGVYFLWFFIYDKRKNKKQIIVTLFFIALAYKRIELFALCVCSFFYLFWVRKTKCDIKKILCIFLGVFGAYAIFSWNDGFGKLMEFLGVDSLGRTEVYSAILQSLTSNDQLIGKGMGWITDHLIDVSGNWRGYSDLHNDYLKFFIELGVVGGAIFWLLWIVVVPSILMRTKTHVFFHKIFLCVLLYNLILFCTDNVIRYLLVNIAFYQIIFLNSDKNFLRYENV